MSAVRPAPARTVGPVRGVVGVVGLLVATALVVLALVAAHLFVGRSELSAGDVASVLVGRPRQEAYEIIVLRLRLPRVLVGLGAGALLAVSGVLVQAVVRNPLAEPATTGVGSGAAFAVVLSLLVAPGHDLVPLAALVGAVAAGAVLLLVGRRSLALTGILVGAVFAALTSFALVVDSAPMGTVLRWLVGSLNARTTGDWQALWPWLALVPVAWLLASTTNAWALGAPTAVGLGVRPRLTPAVVLGVAVLAAAAAITAAGAVAFVGLVAPHVARLLVGPDHRRLVPVAAVLGAVLLSAADLVAFSVSVQLPGTGPDVSGVPVGAVTALVGAPLLVHLVRKGAAR
ncbi:iron ABC transporter permease [Nocardioides zeae]|uniref:Iron ABC transporter permease n=1 Tax=Nocardioides imazamoxiresistens TaxID=3231893 RepID=A0ABU3Q171_9ACTN|nr:iron ABC transporter permease [Nocardioides zeae]MDT9595267.1 iron ABC transporter permease [Nocardioides zeae]